MYAVGDVQMPLPSFPTTTQLPLASQVPCWISPENPCPPGHAEAFAFTRFDTLWILMGTVVNAALEVAESSLENVMPLALSLTTTQYVVVATGTPMAML